VVDQVKPLQLNRKERRENCEVFCRMLQVKLIVPPEASVENLIGILRLNAGR